MSNAPGMNLAGMQRTEGAQKGLLDGLWCYAAGTSETVRTVSLEGQFSELPLCKVLGSSSRFAGIVFLSQEGGMGVARLKDNPSSEARMIAECEV